MPDKTPPNLSHLKVDELVKVIKEGNLADIQSKKEFIGLFMDRAGEIGKMDAANVDKVAKLMGSVAIADGGCGSFSGGCC